MNRGNVDKEQMDKQNKQKDGGSKPITQLLMQTIASLLGFYTPPPQSILLLLSGTRVKRHCYVHPALRIPELLDFFNFLFLCCPQSIKNQIQKHLLSIIVSLVSDS